MKGRGMLDRISIVIPTRNEAACIRDFLASLPDDVELIVVDASDDATPAIIRQARPCNTRVIRAPVHIAAARQIGARASQREWLVFSDADVRFGPDYFPLLAKYLNSDAFYGRKSTTSRHPSYHLLFATGQRVCHAFGVPAASGSNMAIRRDVFHAIGGFRADLSVNEDTECFLRLAHHGYHIAYASDLEVHSLDDRRLDSGATRKLLHSIARGALLLLNIHIPVPRGWLRHDWGYWRGFAGRDMPKRTNEF